MFSALFFHSKCHHQELYHFKNEMNLSYGSVYCEWANVRIFFVSCIVDPIFIFLIHMFATCAANWISTHFIFFFTYRHHRLMCVCVCMQSGVFDNTCPLISSTEWSFECAHYSPFTIYHGHVCIYLNAIYTFQAQIDSICRILNIIIAILIIIIVILLKW